MQPTRFWTDDLSSCQTPRMRAVVAFGSARRFLAELFAWLLPLAVVAEYVGTTFGDTVAATSALLVLFVGVLWISPPEALSGWEAPRWLVWLGRALGVAAIAGGLWLMAPWLLPLLDPKHHPLPPIGNQRQRELFIYAPVLAAYPVAFGGRLVRGRASGRDLERLGLLIGLVLLIHQMGQLRVQFLPVLPYGRPGLDTVTLTAALVLLALLLVPRVPPFLRMLALLGVGLGLRYVGLETWKLDPSTRDMLPLVKSAQDAFLSGANPYGLHQMQRGSVVPLTYLPGMWLLWGLPRFLGAADFRLMGLVADAAVVLGLFWAASGVASAHRERAQGAAVGFAAVWLMSPSMAWNGIYAEPHAWWLVLALVLAFTARKRWWLAAVALGVAMATRHFAIVVAPFVVVAMLRELGLRRALPKIALAGSIAAVLLVPFVWRNPDAFWFGTFRWLVEYGPVHEGWFWEKFGFAGPLYKADKTEWMPRAQLVVALLMLVVALFVRGRRRFLAPAGTAYVLFIMFNGIIWDSFYLGCSLFAAFAAAGGYTLAEEPRLRPSPPSRRAFQVALAGLALAVASVAYLGFTFWISRSDTGRELVKQHLAQKLAPDDALVDRADWQLAFVNAKPVLDAPPTSVAREPLDPLLGPHGALGHPRAWFVLRSGRESALYRELHALGTAIEDRRIGHYRLLGIENLGVSTLLPSSPPRPCRLGGTSRAMPWHSPARGAPATATFRGPLGKKLVLVGGFEDGGVVWGRKPARAEVRLGGRPLGALRLGNLPGTQLAVIDTSRVEPGEREVELSLHTRDPSARTVCLDLWVLGSK